VARSAVTIKRATRSPRVLIHACIEKVKEYRVRGVLEFWATFGFRVAVACCCTFSSPAAAPGKVLSPQWQEIKVIDIASSARLAACAECN
jgi:hypothetical protein